MADFCSTFLTYVGYIDSFIIKLFNDTLLITFQNLHNVKLEVNKSKKCTPVSSL
jgi:hypothetical protein